VENCKVIVCYPILNRKNLSRKENFLQVVILAGGLGTRLSEETSLIPKALVRVGDLPILVHIMRYFASFGHKDFLIALGYKGDDIKRYFLNFKLLQTDIEIDLKLGRISNLGEEILDWNIKLVDTGTNTMTGGRLKRLESYLEDKFFLTYCDGLSNVDLREVVKIFDENKSVATVTAVHNPSRFGTIKTAGDGLYVEDFLEKATREWINGGYFCMSKIICDYIEGDDTVLELEPLKTIAQERLLTAYKHSGFWQPMDTLKERNILENLWARNEAPWSYNIY
jgi:glucose-1-phosphate cytidylyltransferase